MVKISQGSSVPCTRFQGCSVRRARVQVGGRLVYSTCTFNPIEDEAVVASVLLATKGALRLVDCSGSLPALKRRAGLSSWQVRSLSYPRLSLIHISEPTRPY